MCFELHAGVMHKPASCTPWRLSHGDVLVRRLTTLEASLGRPCLAGAGLAQAGLGRTHELARLEIVRRCLFWAQLQEFGSKQNAAQGGARSRKVAQGRAIKVAQGREGGARSRKVAQGRARSRKVVCARSRKVAQGGARSRKVAQGRRARSRKVAPKKQKNVKTRKHTNKLVSVVCAYVWIWLAGKGKLLAWGGWLAATGLAR